MATDSQNRTVSGVGLPPEVVEDILAAPRRRAVLECLADAEDCLVMDDLVERVIDREGSDVEGEHYERVRANIYDDHLPKLTATGVVTYDSMRECVALATPTIIDHIDG